MSNINRSFTFSNDQLLVYLRDGDFARDVEDIIFYSNAQNADTDALFALVRRLEFILPEYEEVLVESMADHSDKLMGVDQACHGIVQIVLPDLIRYLSGDQRRLSTMSLAYAEQLVRWLICRSRELRTLVMCWLMSRISVLSATDEVDSLVSVPARIVS